MSLQGNTALLNFISELSTDEICVLAYFQTDPVNLGGAPLLRLPASINLNGQALRSFLERSSDLGLIQEVGKNPHGLDGRVWALNQSLFEEAIALAKTVLDPRFFGIVELVRTLSVIWEKIRQLHPDLPSAILLPLPNRQRVNLRRGFSPVQWKVKAPTGRTDSSVHEVWVTIDHIDGDPKELLAKLLHEAAHAINHVHGVKDYSHNQYHNLEFKGTAERVGLVVAQIQHYGFEETSLSEEAEERYQHEIELLRQIAARPITRQSKQGPKYKHRLKKATCDCPHIIRVTRKVLDATGIQCTTCKQLFRCVED